MAASPNFPSIPANKTNVLNPAAVGRHGATPSEANQPRIRSRVASIWTRIGLNISIVKTMFKGALPPTIAIAMYQADAVAETYGTVGNVIAIIAILSLCTLPRMKFLQILLLNVLGTCLACAMSFLGLVCSTKARSHSEARPLADFYNGSASAVCAIFLFTNIYAVNTMRARFPALQFPAICYSIYMGICFANMPLFDMSRGSAFIWRLTETFFTGFALAAVVSLLIFPLSSRVAMFRQLAVTIGSLRLAIHPQLAPRTGTEGQASFEKEQSQSSIGHDLQSDDRQAIDHSKLLGGNFSKLLVDMASGKFEVAWGVIDAADIDHLSRLLKALITPTLGLGLRGDAFKDFAKPTLHLLQEISQVGYVMDAALDHVTMQLDLASPQERNQPQPVGDLAVSLIRDKIGQAKFAELFQQDWELFRAGREKRIMTWLDEESQGLEVTKSTTDASLHATQQFAQQQLYLLLYVEHLMESCATSAFNLIQFADQKAESKRHFIFPANLLRSNLHHFIHAAEDPGHSVSRSSGRQEHGRRQTEGYFAPIDVEIEHLPPATTWERHSNYFRTIGHILRSPESVFGLRVTLATASIGIVAFLHTSQLFFQKNRLVWALVISTIGMSWTSGQTIFGLVIRLLGTLIASILSLVIWYIVDGHTAGVIIFLFLFTSLEFYFLIKFPKYVVIAILAMITQVLIVGYELQVGMIGEKAAELSGQPYYPVYVLAPYRLACVTGGCLVACFWTIFPYPITDRSQLRKDLGASIYMLAKYYACVHAGIVARYQGTEGDPNSPTSHGNLLAQIEGESFTDQIFLLGGLAQKAEFTKWELAVGGKFPRKRFENVIQGTQSLMNNLTLMAHITKTLPRDSTTPWFRNLARLLKEINPTSHDVVTTLVLLSASVTNGNALPPYLRAPAYFEVSRRLMAMDSEILSMKYVSEEGYAAYAALQVAITLVSADLEKLIENVRELVGEVNFRFLTGDEESI